jgi:hypothetical protein
MLSYLLAVWDGRLAHISPTLTVGLTVELTGG